MKKNRALQKKTKKIKKSMGFYNEKKNEKHFNSLEEEEAKSVWSFERRRKMEQSLVIQKKAKKMKKCKIVQQKKK